MPIRQDVSLWRGNNAPAIVWTLPEDGPLGAAYFLAIEAGGQLVLAADTTTGALVFDADALSWTPGLAESRLVPPGRVARYEIEQRADGIETTIFFGSVTGLGGINTDAGSSAEPTMLDAADPENSLLLLMGWLA